MLRVCASCDSYVITEPCVHCGGERTLSPKPPKYSVEDRYGKYRRMAKEQNG